LTTLVGAAALVAAIYALHRQSFCISEWRFITDKEKGNAGALWAFHSNNGMAESQLSVKPQAYNSFQEFNDVNPNCCRVIADEVRWAGDRWETVQFGFFDYLFGLQVDALLVEYKERLVNERGDQEVRTRAVVVPVSSCGKIVID